MNSFEDDCWHENLLNSILHALHLWKRMGIPIGGLSNCRLISLEATLEKRKMSLAINYRIQTLFTDIACLTLGLPQLSFNISLSGLYFIASSFPAGETRRKKSFPLENFISHRREQVQKFTWMGWLKKNLLSLILILCIKTFATKTKTVSHLVTRITTEILLNEVSKVQFRRYVKTHILCTLREILFKSSLFCFKRKKHKYFCCGIWYPWGVRLRFTAISNV